MRITLVVFLLLCGVAVAEGSQPPSPSMRNEELKVLGDAAKQNNFPKHLQSHAPGFSEITTAHRKLHTGLTFNQSKEESADKTCWGWFIRFNRLFSNGWVAVFTGGLFFVACFQFWMFTNQLGLMRDSMSETRTASEAAKESAEAAKQSADALKMVERAYLFVTVELSGGKVFIGLQNHGKTPAILSKLYIDVFTQETAPAKIGSTVDKTLPRGIVIATGRDSELSIPMTEIIRNNITYIKPKRPDWKKVKIFCYGKVEYLDVIKESQTTTFCWEFDRKNRAFVMSESDLNDYT